MEEILEATVQEDEIEDYQTIDVDGSEDEDDIESENNPNIYPNASIKIDKDQYSVYELKRKYDKGKICMDPSFQRNFVWKTKQMSELIESVIMGIPIPLIYLAENEKGDLVVVDGRQRLTTFFRFLDNKFRLNKLSILKEINGCDFKKLEREHDKYASAVEDFQLVVQVIKYPTPDRIRFDIFDRVNRGGTPLNKQEMRNALYQGHSTELLKNLAENPYFKKALGGAVSGTHMKDRYIILRAIAFDLYFHQELTDGNGKLFVYKSDMEDFLGTTMGYLNRCAKEKVQNIEKKFVDTMNTIYDVMGEDVFRLDSTSERKRPVSMTLFETLFYLFDTIIQAEQEVSYEDVRESVYRLKKDKEFLNNLQKSVDSTSSVTTRFSIVENECKELLNV